jgi:hypothetical protein
VIITVYYLLYYLLSSYYTEILVKGQVVIRDHTVEKPAKMAPEWPQNPAKILQKALLSDGKTVETLGIFLVKNLVDGGGGEGL